MNISQKIFRGGCGHLVTNLGGFACKRWALSLDRAVMFGPCFLVFSVHTGMLMQSSQLKNQVHPGGKTDMDNFL